MSRSQHDHDVRGKNTADRADEARRHFLGITAAVAAKAVAVGGLGATILPSLANAQSAGKAKGRDKDKGGKPGKPGKGPKGPACFLRGTSILTPSGLVRVEDLERGDTVLTVEGESLPVLWIGRSSYRRSGSSWQEEVMPIRVARGAISDQSPHSDLYLSPNHALFLDGILIRAKDLVNGTSIARALPDDREVIEYFNLVLAGHEVILAEGLPVETFRARDHNHESFSNFAQYERLYPERAALDMKLYAPLAGSGGGRAHLKALLGLAASPFIRMRDPVAEAHRKLALRAEALAI